MSPVDQVHHRPTATADEAAVDLGLRAFMIGVYNKVALGLLLSASLAYVTSTVPAVRDLLFRTVAVNGAPHLAGVTVPGLICAMSPIMAIFTFGMGRELTPQRTGLLYWAVAASVGASLGMLVLIYTGASIATAFFAAAAAFGGLSLVGYTTGKALTALGSFLISGLVGLGVTMVVNLFLRDGAVAFAVNAAGALIFAGLIAYDTQRLKLRYAELEEGEDHLRIATNCGALSLYLDFVNLFQFLLVLTGTRR